MVIQVDRKKSMAKVGEIISNIAKEVEKNIPGSDISVRTHPIHLNDETIIDLINILAGKNDVSIHGVAVDELGGCKCISYHVEVSDCLNARDAHKVASDFEKTIKEELGGEVTVNCHIEPVRNGAALSYELEKEEEGRLMELIKEISLEIKEVSGLHNFIIRKIDGGYFISFHCLVAGDLPLEEVHEVVDGFERLIKERIREARRVIIHAEPQ